MAQIRKTGGPRLFLFFVLAASLFSTLAKAEGEENRTRLSPLAKTLKRLFIDKHSGITNSNVTGWTPEVFEKLGITKEQIQSAVEELKAAHPDIQQRLDAGQNNRRIFREGLDETVDPVLESEKVQTKAPYQILRDFIDFARGARDKSIDKMPELRVKVESATQTQVRYSEAKPKYEDEIDDYRQRKEQKLEQDEEIQVAKAINEENFEYWRGKELALIDKLIISNLQVSLRRDLAPLKKQGFWKKDLPSLKWKIVTLKDGKLAAQAPYRDKTIEIPIEDSSRDPLKRLKDAKDVDDLVSNRLANLNRSLLAMRKVLKQSSWEDPPERIERNLNRETTRYRENLSTSENLLVRPNPEFWGPDLDNLIWSRVKKSYWPYWRRSLRAFFSLNGNSFAASATGRKVRPAFGVVYGVLATAAGVAALGPALDLWEPSLEPARHTIVEPAKEIAMQKFADFVDSFDLELGHYEAPRGDFAATVNSGEVKQPIFEIISGSKEAPDRLQLATQEELAHLKPLTLQKGSPRFKIISKLQHWPVNGLADLPGSEKDALSDLVIEADGKTLGPNDYELMQTDTGIPVVVLHEPYKKSAFRFQTGYVPEAINRIEHTIPAERVQLWVNRLKRSGFTVAANQMQAEVDLAVTDQRPVAAAVLSKIIKNNSLYTYFPPHAPYSVPESDELKDLTAFLNEAAVICGQCTVFAQHQDRELRFSLGEDGSIRVWIGQVIPRDGSSDFYATPFHVVNYVAPEDDLRSAEILDSTPGEKDPRAPKPASKLMKIGRTFTNLFHSNKEIPVPGPGVKSSQNVTKEGHEKKKSPEKKKDVQKNESGIAKANDKKEGEVAVATHPPGPFTEPIEGMPNTPLLPQTPQDDPTAPLQNHWLPPGATDAWHRDEDAEWREPPFTLDVLVPPPSDGISELEAILKKMEESPSFNRLRRRSGDRFVKLPPTVAYRLGKALVDYSKGKKHFSEVASAFKAIAPTDPELDIKDDSEITKALPHAAKWMKESMQNFQKGAGRSRNLALSGRVEDLFEVAARHDWELHREGRFDLCRRALKEIAKASAVTGR